jgi:hypothetical protein
MRFSFWTYFISLLLTLHCIGGTQLLSAYAKDNISFVRMLTMTEEETKKEKDNKTDDDTDHEFKCRQNFFYTVSLHGKVIYQFARQHEQVRQQFITELPTPPPDPKA